MSVADYNRRKKATELCPKVTKFTCLVWLNTTKINIILFSCSLPIVLWDFLVIVIVNQFNSFWLLLNLVLVNLMNTGSHSEVVYSTGHWGLWMDGCKDYSFY